MKESLFFFYHYHAYYHVYTRKTERCTRLLLGCKGSRPIDSRNNLRTTRFAHSEKDKDHGNKGITVHYLFFSETRFVYGSTSVTDFKDGFFCDNSKFIPLIESLKTKAVVSLHPRRFGKSLFVNLLNEYYDIRNKDNKTWQKNFGWNNDYLIRFIKKYKELEFSRTDMSQDFVSNFRKLISLMHGKRKVHYFLLMCQNFQH